jgi:hypothetical protein
MRWYQCMVNKKLLLAVVSVSVFSMYYVFPQAAQYGDPQKLDQ